MKPKQREALTRVRKLAKEQPHALRKRLAKALDAGRNHLTANGYQVTVYQAMEALEGAGKAQALDLGVARGIALCTKPVSVLADGLARYIGPYVLLYRKYIHEHVLVYEQGGGAHAATWPYQELRAKDKCLAWLIREYKAGKGRKVELMYNIY